MSLLDLIFPSSCIHCRQWVDRNIHFCPECLIDFTLLASLGRCTTCFQEIEEEKGICLQCEQTSPPFTRLGGCFDSYGPAKSLLESYFKKRRFGLAKELSSLLFIQHTTLQFPPVDRVSYIPCLGLRGIKEIGRELATLFEVPFSPMLSISFEEKRPFYLKSKCNIIGANVLLVGPSLKSMSYMVNTATVLQDGGAKSVCGLFFSIG